MIYDFTAIIHAHCIFYVSGAVCVFMIATWVSSIYYVKPPCDFTCVIQVGLGYSVLTSSQSWCAGLGLWIVSIASQLVLRFVFLEFIFVFELRPEVQGDPALEM